MRMDALWALCSQGTPDGLPLLLEALWDQDEDLRALAAGLWQVCSIPLIHRFLQDIMKHDNV